MAYVQSTSGGVGLNPFTPFSTFTLAFANDVVAGNAVLVDIVYFVHSGSPPPMQIVDSSSNTYTRIFTFTSGLATVETWLATGLNASGPMSVEAVFVQMDGVSMAIHEYANVVIASPIDTFAHATAASPTNAVASISTSYDTQVLHAWGGSSTGPFSLAIGQALGWTAREAYGTLMSFDVQVSQVAPAVNTFTLQQGVSLTHPTDFACIIGLKVPISPANPGSSWLIINEPGLSYVDQSAYFHKASEQSFSLVLRQRGTAKVSMFIAAGNSYSPTIGAQVFLFDQNLSGHSLVFAGTIDLIEIEWVSDLGARLATLTVVSFEQCFDALLVPPQTFYYQKAEDIFNYLLATIAGGVPVIPGTINASFVINSLSTDWSRLSEVFDELATAANCIWGVDLSTLSVFLKPISATPSPFTLHSANVLWGSNKWEKNRQDFRNRQILRISIDAFAQSAELFAFSGTPQTFTLMRPAQEVTQAYFTKNTQNSATGTFSGIPANGDTVTIGYPQTGSIYNWAPNAPYYVGQIIVDPANHIQACTTGNSNGGSPTARSGSSQPTWNDTGGTTSDGAIVWTDRGVSGAGGIGSSVYTFVTELDNTQWGQVLIGQSAGDCAFYLAAAINADQNQAYVGSFYSWPTWENPVVNCDNPGGATTITVRNKSAGSGYIAALSSSSSAFSWGAGATSGGTTTTGTVVLQVSAQGQSNSANIYYTPGSFSVSMASRPTGVPSSGGYIQIQYKRAASDCIVVENTDLVNQRAAIENGTGKYQMLASDTSNTSNTSGLQKAQSALASFSEIPISFKFKTFVPGLQPGQLLAISFIGAPVGINILINGSYVIQEIAGALVPVYDHLDPVVPNGGHYEYTVTVINVSQIFDYLDFWQQMGSGGSGGGGSLVAGTSTNPPGVSSTSATNPGGVSSMGTSGNLTPDLTAWVQLAGPLTGSAHILPPVIVTAFDTFLVQIQPNGHAVTWDSFYTGLSEFVLDQTAGTQACLLFQINAGSTSAQLMLPPSNGWSLT